jgi:hypothetical protein
MNDFTSSMSQAMAFSGNDTAWQRIVQKHENNAFNLQQQLNSLQTEFEQHKIWDGEKIKGLQSEKTLLAKQLESTERERDYAQASLVAARYAYFDALRYIQHIKSGDLSIDEINSSAHLDGEDKDIMALVFHDFLYSKGYNNADDLKSSIGNVNNETFNRFVSEIRLDIGKHNLDSQHVDGSGYSTNYKPRYQRNAEENELALKARQANGNHFVHRRGQNGDNNYKVREPMRRPGGR